MARQKTTKSQEKISKEHNTLSVQDIGIDAPKNKISSASFSMYIRALLQNWRQGTVACKGRSDLAFSNRKPWKQKGTGRARAGSLRSPLWRKGGVIFGPQMRTRVLKVSKNLKNSVLGSLIYDRLNNGLVACLDWQLDTDKPKTAAAYSLLKNAKLEKNNLVVFMAANDAMSYSSFINIPNVRVLFYDQPNAFDLTKSDRWVVFKKDVNSFKEMVEKCV